MSAADNIQKTRETEFNKLLNSIANDTPLLLFPLRIETHFRKSRTKTQEEGDLLKILRRFHDLTDKFIEYQGDENYKFIPLMAKVREAVEVADLIPAVSLASLSSLTKNIFQDLFYPARHVKYSRYEKAIIEALSNVTKDRGMKSVIVNSSDLFVSHTQGYSNPTSFNLQSALSSFVVTTANPAPSSGMAYSALGFPGADNLYDTENLKAQRLRAVIESWIEAVEKEEQENPDDVPARPNTSFSPSSGAVGMNFPGAYNLFDRKELCVRIFPDEVFLDYLTDDLTEKEILDGKIFWLQWFIASGSRKREYEAWQVLCEKYPPYRAAWIVRQLKPDNINNFKKGGKFFYRRPYQGMATIEDACDDIYLKLSLILLDDSEDKEGKDIEEYRIEKAIRENLGFIKEHLFQIDRDVIYCEYIVDYLFDKIRSTMEYLGRRLDAFISFYEKHEGVYKGNLRQMELWDVDHTLLVTFRKEVDAFLERLGEKRIPLDDLLQKYLNLTIDEPWLHNIFRDVKVNSSGKPDVPVSHILPDRFMFIGEAEGRKNEKIIHYGRRVKQNLQIGVNPNEDIDEEPYNINKKGDLEVNGGIAWMVDYDKAEEAGMAITVPLDYSITKFKYIYVLGVKDTDGREKEYLHSLFNSHNYTSSGLEMLKPGTPTNIVDGGKPVCVFDQEQEMLRRYEAEVEDAYDNPQNKEYDSWKLSNILNLDYGECWGHTVRYDNRELSNAETAHKALWTHFKKNMALLMDEEGAEEKYEELNSLLAFLEGFVINNLKARGTIPSFRIGSQPYGVLPITNFRCLNKNIQSKDPVLLKQLNKLLVSLAYKWKEIRDNQVISSETLKGNEAAGKYLEMAGLTPYSTTFYERRLINSPLLPERDAAVPNYLLPLKEVGFFDPLPVGDTEKEVEFGIRGDDLLSESSDSPQSKLARYLKRLQSSAAEEDIARASSAILGKNITAADLRSPSVIAELSENVVAAGRQGKQRRQQIAELIGLINNTVHQEDNMLAELAGIVKNA
ncbi:MAG: hypothetical protein LBV07_02410, partial [Syntrophobacterales bacterium]|nr:hypothetical protein [Syntrophobacterales bacterium]